jgi:outer membrane lipoprotein carrier protein
MRLKLSARIGIGLLLALWALPVHAAGLREVIGALESPFKASTPAEQQIKDYTADFFQESRIASLDRLQRARGQVSVRFEYQRNRSDQVPVVMFHWEYQEPTTQELISDGKTLWVYLPENNQVIQSDVEMVSRARENDPMTFLTGLGNLSRDFLINWAEPNRDADGNYVLDLKPRRTTALLNRMVIVVDRAAVDVSSEDAAAPSPMPSMEPPVRPSRRTDPRSTEPSQPPKRSSQFDTYFQGRGRPGGLIFPILSTTVYDPNGNSTTIEFSELRVNLGLSAGEFNFIRPPGVEVVRPTGKEMGF